MDKLITISGAYKKEIILNMKDEVITGNVLDIGENNNGIIYNLCKDKEDKLNIDYITKDEENKPIEKEYYHKAIFFFTLSKNFSRRVNKNILREVKEYLKSDGEIIIWDIEKPLFAPVKTRIKILLPDNKYRYLNFNNFNFFSSCSKEKIIKLVEETYDLVEVQTLDNIYCIRGKKKERGCSKDEGGTSRNKCQIHTLKLGDKIFKSLYK